MVTFLTILVMKGLLYEQFPYAGARLLRTWIKMFCKFEYPVTISLNLSKSSALK